ncbi:hypothetical protein ACOMHN_064014 [Nucella lapillus]
MQQHGSPSSSPPVPEATDRKARGQSPVARKKWLVTRLVKLSFFHKATVTDSHEAQMGNTTSCSGLPLLCWEAPLNPTDPPAEDDEKKGEGRQTDTWDSETCFIELHRGDSKYYDVHEAFGKLRYYSGGSSLIGRIFKLHNPALDLRYRQRQIEMEEENGGGEVTERFLFHGTPMWNVDSIAREGFRLPDTPPCLGKSVCLATCSWLSDPYTDGTVDRQRYPLLAGPPTTLDRLHVNLWVSTSSRHYTFMCRVLVGSPAPSHHDCHQPLPPGCHHVQGQGSHQLQWGIFDVDQIFPMYLIEWWDIGV